jgi:putative salt-induced outer membrane protein YdiY
MWSTSERARDLGAHRQVTTAESYTAGCCATRLLRDELPVCGRRLAPRSIFSYDQQIAETVGYGRRLIDNERQMLSIEGGAGAKQSELVDGTSLDNAIVRGGLDYLLHIGESSEFSQKLLVEQSDDNRYTESTSALKARVVGNIRSWCRSW